MSGPAPITCEALPPEWIAERRAIVAAHGYALRGGAGRAGGFTVEVKSLVDNEWRVLELPDRAREFALERDRDAVLRALNICESANAAPDMSTKDGASSALAVIAGSKGRSMTLENKACNACAHA